MPVHIESVVIFSVKAAAVRRIFPARRPHQEVCQRDTERVKLLFQTAQREAHGLVAGRTRELRERERWKVICVRLVEDRQGGLANFVIWF